ncbi:MAG: exodeoxyribonuclease VII small subunit [Eubacteriales bacterium]|nr:exodeoxyribonuclease VII small subunit [Eubacteriales bacterium]
MAEKNVQEAQELTLEESFEKLENMLAALESRDITLEQSFDVYQKGMELIRQCNRKIDCVEKKMQVMDEEGGLSDF